MLEGVRKFPQWLFQHFPGQEEFLSKPLNKFHKESLENVERAAVKISKEIAERC